ncbi:hypothetical protein NKH37_28775 [Mesorhizobium sp. M1217]|uniref:hypothetical protein n=1 Tax=Mesorhizobium sp. M1217 TaxID=2957070 RepID=UPI00333DE952
MSEPAIRPWHDMVGRLRGNEPLRLLIGERLYSSSEIVPARSPDDYGTQRGGSSRQERGPDQQSPGLRETLDDEIPF